MQLTRKPTEKLVGKLNALQLQISTEIYEAVGTKWVCVHDLAGKLGQPVEQVKSIVDVMVREHILRPKEEKGKDAEVYTGDKQRYVLA